MAGSLEEKKKSLMAQLEMVRVYCNCLQNTSVKSSTASLLKICTKKKRKKRKEKGNS